jgi:NADPH-dependent curcumin reductase CurA
MTQGVNRQWRLETRSTGLVDDSHFRWVEEPIPTLTADGQILVRNLYLSADPAQRTWMARDTYIPAVPLGEVMRSLAVGRVEDSRHPDFARGELVQGLFGWQDYALVTAKGSETPTKLPPGVPIPLLMSALGITGLTAYFGLLEIGRPVAGETVVVSGAAGATG